MGGIEPERQIAPAVVAYRHTTGMTVEQLSEATGIPRADIIRLEEGIADPTLSTLKRLAAGMGMALKLEFVPIPPAGR